MIFIFINIHIYSHRWRKSQYSLGILQPKAWKHHSHKDDHTSPWIREGGHLGLLNLSIICLNDFVKQGTITHKDELNLSKSCVLLGKYASITMYFWINADKSEIQTSEDRYESKTVPFIWKLDGEAINSERPSTNFISPFSLMNSATVLLCSLIPFTWKHEWFSQVCF